MTLLVLTVVVRAVRPGFVRLRVNGAGHHTVELFPALVLRHRGVAGPVVRLLQVAQVLERRDSVTLGSSAFCIQSVPDSAADGTSTRARHPVLLVATLFNLQRLGLDHNTDRGFARTFHYR